MDRTASFMRKLEEIAREYELPLRGIELVKSRMCWEDWHGLRKEGVIFAREELRKRKWRGAHGGVRPGCGDAEDIVDEAIGQMLEGKCRAGLGGGRERLSKELKRLLSQKIRALHGLRETTVMRSEWDAEPAGEDEQATSVFNAIPDEKDKKRSEAKERLGEIEDFLADEPKLQAVFGCLWSGMTNPAEIGSQLGMDEREVVRTRQRLNRRIAEFRRLLLQGKKISKKG